MPGTIPIWKKGLAFFNALHESIAFKLLQLLRLVTSISLSLHLIQIEIPEAHL